MKMPRILPVCSLLFLAACSAAPSRSPTSESVQSSSKGVVFGQEAIALESPDGKRINLQVELAGTPDQQERGLMGRDKLEEGTGMLFLFGQPQALTFWMKNTLIPLDILFFDADRKFLSSATMAPCQTDPCPVYSSSEEAAFAIETPAGFVKKNGVNKGWKLQW